MVACVCELNRLGVITREQGNPSKALGIFQDALRMTSNSLERAGIVGEIALCHQHLGRLELAETLYQSAIDDFCLNSDVAGVARMRRQLSSIYLSEGDIDKAYEMALRARNMVVDTGICPTDLCHLTHGIIKVLYAKRKVAGFTDWWTVTKEICRWVWIEGKETLTMMEVEKTIARDVWLTGFLADVAFLLPPITLPAGALGYFIAKRKHLGLRLEQVSSAR